LEKKSAPPEENPGYAYKFAHPWKKILRAPVYTSIPADSDSGQPLAFKSLSNPAVDCSISLRCG